MGSIEEIYADLDVDVSEEEFRDAVDAKVEEMGGLADRETAAMLLAHELGDQAVNHVADIEPAMEEVKFVAKVVSVGELREFDREDDDEPGRVINAEVADETGQVTAAFWDEQAEAAADELEPGTVLRLLGRPREGYRGLEVSIDRVEPDEDVEIDVPTDGPIPVEALATGRSDVTLRGVVLETEPIRTFERDDGTEGRVSNLVLGDETGRVRVTLWDEQADRVEAFSPGETVEVIDGYVRERDGDLELHVGRRGRVESIDAEIEYVPETTDIEALELGETADIAGVVRSADPVRTFDRDDGSEGQVRNIRVQDQTGDIRVALWGEKADVEVTPGDEVQLADVEVKEGWQDDLEASAGWRSTVTVLGAGPAPESAGPAGDRPGSSEPGLSAFAETDDPEEAGSDPDDPDPSEPTEFTGVVVQAGDPVVLDDGERTVSLRTDADLELGQEVTVRGRISDGRMDVEEIA